MALKQYKAETLNGNWFEERAPPLSGVLADYGMVRVRITIDISVLCVFSHGHSSDCLIGCL